MPSDFGCRIDHRLTRLISGSSAVVSRGTSSPCNGGLNTGQTVWFGLLEDLALRRESCQSLEKLSLKDGRGIAEAHTGLGRALVLLYRKGQESSRLEGWKHCLGGVRRAAPRAVVDILRPIGGLLSPVLGGAAVDENSVLPWLLSRPLL